MKRIVIALLLLAMICLAAGCKAGPAGTGSGAEKAGGQPSTAPGKAGEAQEQKTLDQNTPEQNTPEQTTPPPEDPRPETLEEQMEKTIKATITMEDGGVISIELYPDLAPQSVRNFVYLARSGYYDGLNFHRIMKGFMIQGGCPDGTGGGNPGYSIKGEFALNGFENGLSHVRGVLSMARLGNPAYDSAGSQFFIIHGDSKFLDGEYAAFGKVTDGMDVVDRLAEIPNDGPNGSVADKDKPVIKSITIDDDIELPEPNRITNR